MSPLILVLSSPSGGGKTTIARRLLTLRDDCGYSISATTRAPRGVEEDGVHYYFLTPEEFETRVQQGAFIEHAVYNGQRYGTLVSEVDRLRGAGKHVILDIEVVGARLVRRQFPEAILVFVVPPSGTELIRRLRGRGTETELAIAGRLEQALGELSAAGEYDYLVVNDLLEEAVVAVAAILQSESRRVAKQGGFSTLLSNIRSELAAELTRLTDSRTQGV